MKKENAPLQIKKEIRELNGRKADKQEELHRLEAQIRAKQTLNKQLDAVIFRLKDNCKRQQAQYDELLARKTELEGKVHDLNETLVANP